MNTQAKHHSFLGWIACIAVFTGIYLPTAGAADQPRSAGPNSPTTQLVSSPVTVMKPPARTAARLPPRSKIQQAAHGQIIAEPLPAVIYDSHFAEVSCGIEPGCGLEACGTCGPMNCGLVGCDSGGCGPMGCDNAGCDSRGAVCFDECYPLMVPIKRINWSNFEFFGGVHAFSGPPNFAGATAFANERDGSASFGIHEGFNFARPSFLLGGGLSSQFGLRATQSNPSGSEFTDESRQQIFLTGGLFRRVDYGFQGGVVVDYLFDDWYYNVNLTQLRMNLSWKLDPGNEFGYQWHTSLGGDTSNGVIRVPNGAGGFTAANAILGIESVDQHRFYYRRYFNRGGSGELFAGATDRSDGILGAALDIPLLDSLSMRTGVTYLNPDVSTGQVDSQEESWNLSWTFVWHPCGLNSRGCYDRPMFEVADNGSLMVDRN